MVDAVVSFAVERLGDYLLREASFLGEAKNEVSWLKKELEWMLCFIKDAEQRQVGNAVIHQLLSDIRDIAYDAEDILDKHMLQVDDGVIFDEAGTSARRQGFLASIAKYTCILDQKKSSIYRKGKEKISLYGLGKEIQAIKSKLNDVSRRCQLYGLEDVTNKRKGENPVLDKLKQLRRASSFTVDDDNVVGFDDDVEKLQAKLLDKEPARMVISIYGMGGLGKTTLARKLYNNLKDRFNYCAWLSVSQDYKPRDLLLRIIKSCHLQTETENLENMAEEDLEKFLRGSLKLYSYLLVVDDIWHKEDWESLKRALPDNNNRSRVIITTRVKEVTERSDRKAYLHELPFLNPNESWQLFCDKTFGNTNRGHKGMEKLGREMVEKCGGLPLAIVVLGGLLSTKKPQDWRMVRDHIWRHLRSDSIHISYLLDLSFNDLSYQLKLCFLYLSLFPEHYEINVERLIRLLVAEGFISQNENQIMEEVAKENLNELISRSLIQVSKIYWGRVATCRVHNLLRDLAIEKAKALNYMHICDEINNPTRSSVESSCRRQAVYSQTPSCLWLQHANSLSRSLLLFNQEISETISARLLRRFSLLRVLSFESFSGRSLDKDIGKLIHLKYLGTNNSEITKLSPLIVKLKMLETLDLSSPFGEKMELPTEINQLQELKHLIGNFNGTLPIENLTNLQTLKYVEFESWSKLNTDKLINLRELHIEETKWTEEKLFSFESIHKLKKLQFLSVEMLESTLFGSLQPLSCCSCLIELRLRGRMKKLPKDMHALLPNLECLSLSILDPEEDPMPELEKLPNLTILYLFFKCYYVKKSICTANGFLRLEIVSLDTNELEEWQVEEGAMPMLRGLKIPEIPQLKIPERLRSIPPPGEWDCTLNRLI